MVFAQVAGVAMQPDSMQMAQELNMLDNIKLVNILVVNSAVNQVLVNVGNERVDEVIGLSGVVSFTCHEISGSLAK